MLGRFWGESRRAWAIHGAGILCLHQLWTMPLPFFLTQPAAALLLVWNPLFCFLKMPCFWSQTEGLAWGHECPQNVQSTESRGPTKLSGLFSIPGLCFLYDGFILGRFSTLRHKEASGSSSFTFHHLNHPSQKRAPFSHSSLTISRFDSHWISLSHVPISQSIMRTRRMGNTDWLSPSHMPTPKAGRGVGREEAQ